MQHEIRARGKIGEKKSQLRSTVQTLRDKGTIIRFLTNSTLKSRKSCAKRLTDKGIVALPEEVITASYATANYLRQLQPKSCWVMLESDGLNEFKEFNNDEQDPEYLVIGDNRSRFDFDTLNRALRLLLKGTKLIGMIPEIVDSSMGEPELNVGSWVKMLEIAADVQATYVGKPNPIVFEMTLATTDLEKHEVIMVGDKLSSDIAGAKNFGIRSVLLKTGEFEPKHLQADVKPDFVFDTVDEITDLF